MYGYIVYNGFWNSKDIPDPVKRLQNAAALRGHSLEPRPNTAFSVSMKNGEIDIQGVKQGDVILCWDKDVRLYRALQQFGAHLFNEPNGVAVCDDKSATHLALSQQGIPMPETWVAPMTYVKYSEEGFSFLKEASSSLGFPLVLKECFGSLGEQVYLIQNMEELEATAVNMRQKPFLLQKFIQESCGNDKRLYVVGDEVVAAMKRHSDSDFRANIGIGGTGESYTPTKEESDLAIKCCQLLGLQFAGVDLLDSKEGPLVCEVNASAHMAGITECTGVDVADKIIQFVEKYEEATPC